jgi:hypothetical protein
MDPFLSVWIAVFCGIPALVFTYLALTAFVDRTQLTHKDGQVCVRTGPLPWSQAVTIPVNQIDRLICKRTKTGQRGENVFYAILTRSLSGEECPLVTHLTRPINALYVCQCLEEALEIPPGGSASLVRMAGEMERARS